MIHIPLILPVSNSTSLKEGLISCWELDETTGSTAYDSHNSYDLANTGVNIGETEAPSNLGVSYFYSSGTSDYSIYNNGLIGNESDKSISVWVNQTSRPTSRIYQETTGLSSNNEDRYDLLISSTTGLIYYRMIEYGGADVRLTSVTTLNLNTWYHILVTSDGSTHTVYIDGVYDNSVTGTPSTSMTLERTILGNGWNNGTITDWGFNGYIAQAAVWNKALTTVEVSALYNSGNGLAYSNW